MQKYVFGKNGQVYFDTDEELREAVECISLLLQMLIILFMKTIRIRGLGDPRTESILKVQLVPRMP
ncbi:hypothetical protein [Ruminococcus flavefaciens]|uniref:hypothetical protein n=1 Tax=Ruminococcus flavefaciens TaxID=1265 RepID=UPI0026EF5E15|nr:hypothetical protein [Ruminococcus flavefaciens]